jgi:hypothetical protein
MALRGTKKNLDRLLSDFNDKMSNAHPKYTSIEAFNEFKAVDELFSDFKYFVEKLPEIVLLDSLQYGPILKDQLTDKEIKENWQKLKNNEYAANHIKLSCLEHIRNSYFGILPSLSPFNDFCSQTYGNNNKGTSYTSDLDYYLRLYYPNLSAETIGDILSRAHNHIEL